jgi:hypothetical protein
MPRKLKKNKAARHKTDGLLQRLELAFALWQSIAMDFITDLALSNGHDQLWVIVDHYTTIGHFIPLNKKEKKVETLTMIFPCGIWKLHRIPSDKFSDRDS